MTRNPNILPGTREHERERYADRCERLCAAMNLEYERHAHDAIMDDGECVCAKRLVTFRFDESRLDEELEGDAWCVSIGDDEVWCNCEWSMVHVALDLLRVARDCVVSMHAGGMV